MQNAGGEHHALLDEAQKKHGLKWSQVLHQTGLAHVIKLEQRVSTEDKVAALRRLLKR